ncbi:hemA [Symbiodinium sp. CCMP2592]|nr:hemA [Symbiodinium sp. CCMP2592]
MVSREAFSASFLQLLEEAAPQVFTAEYMAAGAQHRFLDFFEVYAGRGRLSSAVQEAPLPKLDMFWEGCAIARRVAASQGNVGQCRLRRPIRARLVVLFLDSSGLWEMWARWIRYPLGPAVGNGPMAPPAAVIHDGEIWEILGQKPEKAEKKTKKKEKKNKKGPIFCHVPTAGIRALAGQSSNSESPESSTETGEGQEEKQGLFRLLNKELQRSLDQNKVEDLSCQQLAYTLCGVATCVVASDLVAVGGESESLLCDNLKRCKRQKDKDAENSSLRKVKAAQTLWRKRLNQVLVLFTGKSQAQIKITSCKTLDDINTLYKSLAKKHARKEGINKHDMNRCYDELLSRLHQDRDVQRVQFLQLSRLNGPNGGLAGMPSPLMWNPWFPWHMFPPAVPPMGSMPMTAEWMPPPSMMRPPMPMPGGWMGANAGAYRPATQRGPMPGPSPGTMPGTTPGPMGGPPVVSQEVPSSDDEGDKPSAAHPASGKPEDVTTPEAAELKESDGKPADSKPLVPEASDVACNAEKEKTAAVPQGTEPKMKPTPKVIAARKPPPGPPPGKEEKEEKDAKASMPSEPSEPSDKSKREIEKEQYGCKRARGGQYSREAGYYYSQNDTGYEYTNSDYNYDDGAWQEAENDLKQLAAGKGQKSKDEEPPGSIISPGTPARARKRRCKRSPRAATASTLKPRRLFAEPANTGSTEGPGDQEEDDDDDDDKFACLSGDDNEDPDLFNGGFKLSPLKKSARKPKQRASGKRKRAASKDCLQESSEAEEPEAIEKDDSANAGTKEPDEDPPAQDPRSKFEMGLLELLLVGMNPTDSDQCMSLLLCEDITTLREAVELFSDVIQSLGKQARDCAQNLTLKARKALAKWPAILKEHDEQLLAMENAGDEKNKGLQLALWSTRQDMASMKTWLRSKLQEHQKLETEAEKLKHKEQFQKKLAFVDEKITRDLPIVHDQRLSMPDWEAGQDILDSCRQAAAAAGLPLRPRLVVREKAAMPSDEQIVEWVPRSEEEPSSTANAVRTDYTPTTSRFLQTTTGHTGVFDVLQVQGDLSSDGYKLFFRASSIWKMFQRKQSFTNWRDNLTCELAEAWRVNLDLHIIRKLGYRGKQAVCVLQIRSCSENLQKASLKSLETLLGNGCPADMKLALLPRSDACTLTCVGHDVDLQSWETFLQWQKFKLASSAQQNFNAGRDLAECFLESNEVTQEMAKLPVKGMAFLCDASPKGRMDVWQPVIGIGPHAIAWTVQRLGDLLPVTASAEVKEQELQSLADKMLQQEASAASKMPRTIGRLKQDRLASREHMRAVLHSLELLDLELAPLPFSLRAADPEKHETREMYGSRAFIFNHESGLAEWVCTPDLDDETKSGVRVTLHPDEGGPLFCAWQFLSALGLPVGFSRDETQLVCKKLGSRRRALSLLRVNAKLLQEQAQAADTFSSVPERHTWGEARPGSKWHVLLSWQDVLLILFPGCQMLTSWLMKAKKSPWATHAVGNTWMAACRRYLQIVP